MRIAAGRARATAGLDSVASRNTVQTFVWHVAKIPVLWSAAS
jgi:hypothetical protein